MPFRTSENVRLAVVGGYLLLALAIVYTISIEPDISLILLALMLFAIFFFHTKVGVFIYTAYLSFEETILQHVPEQFFFFLKYSGDIFLIILLVVIFTKLATRRYNLQPIIKNPFNIPLLVFICLAVLSIIINQVPIFVSLAGLRQILRYVVFYFIVLTICSSDKSWTIETSKSILKLILVLGLIQTGIGFLQLLYGPGSAFNHFLSPGKAVYYEGIAISSGYTTAKVKGLFGTFLTRNIYGLFLLGSSMYTLGLSQEAKTTQTRFIYTFILILFIIFILLSYSRISIFSAIVGSLTIALIRRNFKIFTIVLICTAAFAIYAKGYIKAVAVAEPQMVTLGERIASPFRRKHIEESLRGSRLAIIREFAPRFLSSKYVALGLGPGAFGTPIGFYLNYFEGYKKIGIDTNNPFMMGLAALMCDVGYLALLGQYGILGLAALLWIFANIFRALRRKYYKMDDEFLKGFTIGFIAYTFVFALSWISGVNIEIRQISYYFWLIAALLISIPIPDSTAGETPDAAKGLAHQ